MTARRTLAVAAHEFWDRRLVLTAAAASGFLLLAFPLLPSLSRADLPIYSLCLAWLFGAGSALMVGFQTIGAELASRRISFLFTRPLDVTEMMLGKLLGALGLAGLAAAAVVLPPAIFESRVRDALVTWSAVSLGAALLLPALALGILGGVITQVRSGWVLADVVGAGGVAGICLVSVRPLLAVLKAHGPGHWILQTVPALVATCTALAIALCATWSLASGRSVAVRVHGRLARALWPTLAIMAVAMAPLTLALGRAQPSDMLRIAAADVDATGKYAVVQAVTAPFWDTRPFILELATGRWHSVASSTSWYPGQLALINGGDTFVLRARSFESAPQGRIERLRRAGGGVEVLSQRPVNPYGRIITSRDGGLAAWMDDYSSFGGFVRGGGAVEEFELPEVGREHRIANAVLNLEADTPTFRIIRRIDGQPHDTIESWIVCAGATPRRTGVAMVRHGYSLLDPTGRTLVTVTADDLRFFDAETMTDIRRHDLRTRPTSVTFLQDGRVAATTDEPGRGLLTIVALADPVARTLPIPWSARVVGQIDDRLVLLAPWTPNDFAPLFVADLLSGDVLPVPHSEHLRLAQRHQSYAPSASPRSEAPPLFVDAAGSLLQLNLLTGERKVLFQARGEE